MLFKKQLDKKQKKIIKFINKYKKVQINVGMGVGKTVATLTHINKTGLKALIIAPPLVASNVWSDEALNWEHLKHLKVIPIVGTPVQKKKLLETDCDIHTISVDSLSNVEGCEYEYIVFDESSMLKSHASKRFKIAKTLLAKAKYIVNLTGTPAPNGYLNLWSQYYLLDAGKRLGKNITAYRRKYFNEDYMGFNWDIKPQADKKINKKIKDITLSFEEEDVVGVPLSYHYTKLQLTNKLQKQYDEFKDEFILETGDSMIIADTSAVLSMKLLQFSNGSVINTETGVTETIHDVKIKALKTLMRYHDGNIMILYNFKNDRDRVMDAFKDAQSLETNKNLISDWNKGKVKIMVVHPASIGHGLNLQFGGSHALWYGMTWNLEQYQQTNKRLHRRGQLNHVVINHLIVGDIEDKVIRRLKEKDVTQQSIMEVGVRG